MYVFDADLKKWEKADSSMAGELETNYLVSQDKDYVLTFWPAIQIGRV